MLLSVASGVLINSSIVSFSNYLFHRMNFLSLVLLTFGNDIIISPLSPDLLLFFAAKSQVLTNKYLLVVILGLSSSLAGACAWGLGKTFIKPDILGKAFEHFLKEKHQQITKYGQLAVALSAITPLPYSTMCWLAGMAKMDFTRFFLMTLLRVPRFLISFHFFLMSDSLVKQILPPK